MAQDFKFFDRLYQGFEAEYLVASALFGAGLEAFKLPGDFGFDLLVSNQLEETRDRPSPDAVDAYRAPFPYALQVKSRRVRTEDIRLVNGLDRRELEMTFILNPHEYDLLISSERAFLVCVLFLPPDQRSLSARPLIFWLKGRQLQAMHEREYLQESVDERGQARLTLHVVYRFVPMMRRDAFIERVVDTLGSLQAYVAANPASKTVCDEAVAACRARIADLLPETLESNRAGNEYVAFRRREWNKAINSFCDELTTAKMLDVHQTDLTRIGSATRMFPVDDSGVEHWLKVRKQASAIDEA
ncbi:hypothetical protein [Burkholderia ubonensis]|uniref:DUF4365 domain-containing protein n=1 Tax=Burkholderia ubonensis TaxID=101571 RepID=A0AAW3NDK2_9BURK|nr:hypothetical protein [Burkholderia ubonensis]KVT58073.1 hypothetical protein WK53_28965 [Burkholderia ubonensis]